MKQVARCFFERKNHINGILVNFSEVLFAKHYAAIGFGKKKGAVKESLEIAFDKTCC